MMVAVEFGTDIHEVTEVLVEAAAQDLASMPEYEGCQTAAYAPEPLKPFRKVKHYNYEMMGIAYPLYSDENVLIDYGIVETAE